MLVCHERFPKSSDDCWNGFTRNRRTVTAVIADNPNSKPGAFLPNQGFGSGSGLGRWRPCKTANEIRHLWLVRSRYIAVK